MTSAKYMYNFTVNKLKTNRRGEIGILSVSSNGLVLVGALSSTELHIYTTSGSHVKTLNISDTVLVYDAVWTRRSNILCIAKEYVMLLSITGDILKKSGYTTGRLLSVSQNGDIYITNKSAVCVSTDDGMTWSVQFNALGGNNYIHQAIKVSSDRDNDIFWTVETTKNAILSANEKSQLFVYILNNTLDNTVRSVTRRNVTIPTYIQNDVSVYFLTFHGHLTIFALAYNNNDVLMWSVNGTFSSQLQLLRNNSLSAIGPNCLTVDNANYTMYVALSSGAIVSVFTLIYESS